MLLLVSIDTELSFFSLLYLELEHTFTEDRWKNSTVVLGGWSVPTAHILTTRSAIGRTAFGKRWSRQLQKNLLWLSSGGTGALTWPHLFWLVQRVDTKQALQPWKFTALCRCLHPCPSSVPTSAPCGESSHATRRFSKHGGESEEETQWWAALPCVLVWGEKEPIFCSVTLPFS